MTVRITNIESSLLRILISSFRGSPVPDASCSRIARDPGLPAPAGEAEPPSLGLNADDGPTRIRIEVRGRVSTGLDPVNYGADAWVIDRRSDLCHTAGYR